MKYKVTKIRLLSEAGTKLNTMIVSEITNDIEKYRSHLKKEYDVSLVHLEYQEQPT